MDRWHGMVITKKHHPVNVSLEALEALLEDAHLWSRQIYAIDPNYT